MPDRLTLVFEESIDDNSFERVILAKNLHGDDDLNKITIRPVEVKGEEVVSFTYTYATQDKTENYPKETASAIIESLLGETFQEAYLFTAHREYTWKQSKKGRVTFQHRRVKGAQKNEAIDTSHNRKKNYLVAPGRPYLIRLGVSSLSGNVHDKSQAKYRQINKYVEILDRLLKPYLDKGLKIVDMGSGKGYLTFALYDHLVNTLEKNVSIAGVELRKNLVEQTTEVSTDLGFENLSFIDKDIADIPATDIDVIIALHACDIATDIAIAKGIESQSEVIVVAPCCHKQIRKEMKETAKESPILKHGILLERQAELITDGLRALYLEKAGYRTQVFEFITTEHTAKNVMITAVKKAQSTQDTASIQAQIDAIKKQYNITKHALEDMLTS